MTTLVNESKKINRIAINRIADVERERRCAATREAVRADVVPALPFDDFPGLPRDTFHERAGQTLGNRTIPRRLSVQIGFEAGAENSFHDGGPKTSWKANPSSLFNSNCASRPFNSALISASVLVSVSRLWISSVARAARSSGDNDRASSATVKFVSGIKHYRQRLATMQGLSGDRGSTIRLQEPFEMAPLASSNKVRTLRGLGPSTLVVLSCGLLIARADEREGGCGVSRGRGRASTARWRAGRAWGPRRPGGPGPG